MAVQLRDTLDLHPLSGDFGIEARGVDISRPLAPDVRDRLQQAFHHHRILVVRDQDLSPEAHIATAGVVGVF